MTQEEFNVVFELQMRKCSDILAHKKKEYTGDNLDRLSAFKIAAALQNCDPKAALAGMMSKHVVYISLYSPAKVYQDISTLLSELIGTSVMFYLRH